MPTVKAEDLELGSVLVDPSGALYEVVAKTKCSTNMVAVWLWPDTHPYPDNFQVFEAEEEINFIKQGPSTEPHIAEEPVSD